MDYTVFNFSQFRFLEELIIGSNCFYSVAEFVIDGLNELISLVIGPNSFTKIKNDYHENDYSRSFSISNCDKLKSIKIGRYSFSDYGGGFELFNLPKLYSIKIGEIGNASSNFCYSSFVVEGIMEIVIANE